MGFGVVVLVVGFVGGWVVEIFLLMWVVVVGYGEDGCGFFFLFGKMGLILGWVLTMVMMGGGGNFFG